MAPDEVPHGPDGFPICVKCGEQRRTDQARYPGHCAECIAKGNAGEPVRLPGDAPADADDDNDTNTRGF